MSRIESRPVLCALPDPSRLAGSHPPGNDRLTLAESRRLLPADFEISDEALEALRDQIYALAEEAVDAALGGDHLRQG